LYSYTSALCVWQSHQYNTIIILSTYSKFIYWTTYILVFYWYITIILFFVNISGSFILKFIFHCFHEVSSGLNWLCNAPEARLMLLVWFSVMENESNHVRIEINDFCVCMKCIWLVMHCLVVLVFMVITYYKVVSAITALLQNSYLRSLRIPAKDVTNLNSKLCTIFLLESILYIFNFSLMGKQLTLFDVVLTVHCR
jgi:hypothetical protein